MGKRLGRFVLIAVLSALPACSGPSDGPPGAEAPSKATWIQPAGMYDDFHDFMAATAPEALLADVAAGKISAEAARSMAACFADAVVAHLAPEDLERLNAAARGEKPIEKSEMGRSLGWLKTMDRSARAEMFRPYCPELVDKYGG